MGRLSKDEMALWAATTGRKKKEILTDREIQEAADKFVKILKEKQKKDASPKDFVLDALAQGKVSPIIDSSIPQQLKANVDKFNKFEKSISKAKAAQARIYSQLNKKF